jgi:DNA polymerase (family 10)
MKGHARVSAPLRLEAAAQLLEIAALLRLSGADRFRTFAYERAAKTIRTTEADLGELAAAGRLTSLPDIGPATARVVEEILRTGRSSFLDDLRSGLPPGSAELSRLKSLTRPRIQALHRALGVDGLESLRAAARAGRLQGVKGFGPKMEERIFAELDALAEREGRVLLSEGLRAEAAILSLLQPAARGAPLASAGALRRREPVLGSLDFVAGVEGSALLERFERMPLVAAVLGRSKDSVHVRLASGTDARLSVAQPGRFGALLLRATGPVGHADEVLRRVAAAGEPADAPTEEEVYRRAGLPFFPPEIRGDGSEVVRAAAGALRLDLVEEESVLGYVHCHTSWSDGNATVEQMARAAAERGRAYITITDHSASAHYAGGLSPERLAEQRAEIARVARSVPVRILHGTECDILRNGDLDYEGDVLSRLDVVVASLHERHRLGREETTARLARAMSWPGFKIWGHPLGRLLLRRPPVDCDLGAILDALAAAGGAVEINGDPHRLDLDPAHAHGVRSRGIPFVISTDAHSPSDLDFLSSGVLMARRAGLTADDVLNTLDANAFAERVRPRAA